MELDAFTRWRKDYSLRDAGRLLGVSHEAVAQAERGRMRFDDDRIRQWAESPEPVVAALGLQLWLARNKRMLLRLSDSLNHKGA